MSKKTSKSNKLWASQQKSYAVSILMLFLLCITILGANHTHMAKAAKAATGAVSGTPITTQDQTNAEGKDLEAAQDLELEISYLSVNEIQPKAPGPMRIGVMTPAEPQADIIFVHGHADRLDNHGPLFRSWAEQGYRVIAFDLPSHGESRGQILPIDLYQFDDFFGLIRLLEEETLTDAERPLFLAGWSFGGLVVTRMAQHADAFDTLNRAPEGIVLLTPVVAPLPFSGGDGISRMSTLTHNPAPEVMGPPTPAIPLVNPLFAGRLLLEAWLSTQAELPQSLPVLVLAAGDTEDWYVDTLGLLDWTEQQQSAGVNLTTFQCEGARHMLDHEPFPIGQTVHHLTASFVTAILDGQSLSNHEWSAEATATEACTHR